MFGLSAGKIKTTLKISDLHCSMCEAHINEAIRKALEVNKVKSSYKKGETIIWSDEPLSEDDIRKVVADTGYELTDIITEQTS